MNDNIIKVVSGNDRRSAWDSQGYKLELPHPLLITFRQSVYGETMLPSIRDNKGHLVCHTDEASAKTVFRKPSLIEALKGEVSVELQGGLPQLCQKSSGPTK